MSKPSLWVRRLSRLEWEWLVMRLRWNRLCDRLDCHPAMLLLLMACMGYVAILLAWCVRHMATGAW